MLREMFFALTLSAPLGGCSSPVPSTSSSSHWLTCKTTSDCDGVTGATSCTAGYCTDSAGNHLQATRVGTTCDPLSQAPSPMSLGRILGVGADPTSGTTYVVDVTQETRVRPGPPIQYPDVKRVFVSAGDALVESKALSASAGWGGATSEIDYALDFAIGDAKPAELRIAMLNGETTGMIFDPHPPNADPLTDPIHGTVLEMKDPTSISSLPLKELTGIQTLHSISDVDDGTVLVIDGPLENRLDDYRVFWGKPGDVQERRVLDAVASPDKQTLLQIVFATGPSDDSPLTMRIESQVQIGDAGALNLIQALEAGVIRVDITGTLQGSGLNRTLAPRLFDANRASVSEAALRGLSFTCL